MHVRRTDKSREAKFYNIEEYMVHVEEWYTNYSLKFPEKQFNKSVYLATDAPEILSEARKKLVLVKIFILKVLAIWV